MSVSPSCLRPGSSAGSISVEVRDDSEAAELLEVAGGIDWDAVQQGCTPVIISLPRLRLTKPRAEDG